jgi:hypothetical protein
MTMYIPSIDQLPLGLSVGLVGADGEFPVTRAATELELMHD